MDQWLGQSDLICQIRSHFVDPIFPGVCVAQLRGTLLELKSTFPFIQWQSRKCWIQIYFSSK